MDLNKEAFEKAVWILEKCEKPHGFDAAWPGYDAIWARDSMIMSLGAGVLGEKFRKAIKKSIETLAKHQSPNG
ncbi:MAG: hypothetical protein KC506_01330, partial [Nanoarchaeota archaeon]|nr:hypothetical protein [Nanoarchaeota archaeon]